MKTIEMIGIPTSTRIKQYTCGQWSYVYPPYWTKLNNDYRQKKQSKATKVLP